MASLENVSPSQIKRIALELRSLTTDPPEGIKVQPNETDITDIQAIIEGPSGTPYQEGVFKVKLKLGPDFPHAPPKGFFTTPIFHPNVSSKGAICVNTLKRDWKEDLGIKHILLTIKCLLIVPNPESSLNEEAGRLLRENYDEYARRAKVMTSIHAKKNEEGSSGSKGTGKKATSGAVRAKKKPRKSTKSKKRGVKRL